MSKVFGYFNRPSDKGIVCDGVGAQQHFKDSCDLNFLIKKYPDGVPPPISMPVYGDFTSIGKGLQDSMVALQFVSRWFSSLPSEIRAKFDNDPLKAQQFVLSDPEGSVKLGILSASKPPKADAAGVIGAEKGAVAEPPKPATTSSPEGAATE